MVEPKLLKPQDVADILGCHPASALAICRRIGVPALRLGHRTTRVRSKDLEDGLERLARGLGPGPLVERPCLLAGTTPRAGVSTGPRRRGQRRPQLVPSPGPHP